MKYCTYCGKEIDDNALFCPNCGALQTNTNNQGGYQHNGNFNGQNGGFYNQGGGYYGPNNGFNNQGGGYYGFNNGFNNQGGFAPDDPRVLERSKWISVLCFLVPVAGLILWFAWRYKFPGKATSAAKGALACVAFWSPIIGLILWLALKDNNREVAKAAGIAAIVGAVFSVIIAILEIVMITEGLIPADIFELYDIINTAMLK